MVISTPGFVEINFSPLYFGSINDQKFLKISTKSVISLLSFSVEHFQVNCMRRLEFLSGKFSCNSCSGWQDGLRAVTPYGKIWRYTYQQVQTFLYIVFELLVIRGDRIGCPIA